MASLSVRQFSCIDSADLELSALTILIGPQASGKSVISKLFYYFTETLDQMIKSAEELNDFKVFSLEMADSFKKLFPPSAWGRKVFSIEFTSGDVCVKIVRKRSSKGQSNNISIAFSEYVHFQYEEALKRYRAERAKIETKSNQDWSDRFYSLIWKIRSSLYQKWAKELGKNFVRSQTFIPAGRSFFTTVGKAVTAFEQGDILDRVTIRFGKLFLALRDEQVFYAPEHGSDKIAREVRKDLEVKLFGGDIRIGRQGAYVETNDGRRVPFSILSSGQQELLPLWLVLDYVVRSGQENSYVYIEEPEAHLFPESQGIIVQYLAGLTKSKVGRGIIMTTHSPYVLTKVNNLIKAASVAKAIGKARESQVSKIVPKSAWMDAGHVGAYAIIDRQIVPIISADGLIDGEYLDRVSGDLADEFSALLEIEAAE